MASFIGPALGIVGSLIGGSKQKKSAQQAAAATRPTPYAVSGPAGAVNVSGNQITMDPSSNPFAGLYNMIAGQGLANAAVAPGQAFWGASPEIVEAFQGLTPEGQTAEAEGRYDLLTQLAMPGQNRAFNQLNETLFARGNLGRESSATGEAYRGFEEAGQTADLQRQLAAQDWANQRAQTRFGSALQAVGAGQNAQQLNLANATGLGGVGGLNNLFAQLMQQAQLGVGAGGGQAAGAAVNAAQTPGLFQNIYNVAKEGGVFDKGRNVFSDVWNSVKGVFG